VDGAAWLRLEGNEYDLILKVALYSTPAVIHTRRSYSDCPVFPSLEKSRQGCREGSHASDYTMRFLDLMSVFSGDDFTISMERTAHARGTEISLGRTHDR
jgi:hypothetical protein